jgi:peptidyl-prolyl cis-trans isomerase SurA
MKKHILTAILVGVFSVVTAGASFGAQVIDRIVAVVNGEIITSQELLRQVRLMVGEVPDQATGEMVARQILDSMIDDIVLRQEAERLQIDVADSEVETEIRQFKSRRQMSSEEFERSLLMQGMTEAQFKERTKQDIVKHKILGYMVRRKVVVTQEEIDAYLQKNHGELSTERSVDLQLVVVVDQDLAQSIRTRIVGNEMSFADAVSQYSVGPRMDDGVMRGVSWKELDEPWREAMRVMQPEQISEPFSVQDKWVVLKLLGLKDGVRQDLTAMEEEAREALMRPKLEERFTEYMNGLRAKAVIERRL